MTSDLLAQRKTPLSVAAYWLNLKRCGEMTASDVRSFDLWLSKDPAHRAAYDELERMWDVIGMTVEDPSVMALREGDAKRFNRVDRVRWVGTLAAGVTLAVVSTWVFATSGLPAAMEFFRPAPAQELSTSVGQRATVRLRDNSVVMLDTDTVVRIRESSRERRLELVQGRAFFQVAKDKSRPFIVAAAGRTVRATGTAFDVRVDPNRFQVTLVEGRVRVQDARDKQGKPQTAEMRAGWRLVVGKDDLWQVAPVDLVKEISWHDGQLTFFHDNLSDAVAEMNRYSPRKIVLRGDAPERPLIGVFRAGDVEGFAAAMEFNKIARVTSKDQERIEIAAW